MNIGSAKGLMAGLIVLLLAGCEAPTQMIGVTQRLSAPYVEAQHQYRFSKGSSALSAQEHKRLSAFLNALALQSGDVVIVTIPATGKPRVDAERQSMMQSLLARYPAKMQYLQDTTFGPRPSPYRQVGIIRVTRARGLKVSCQPGVDDLGCASAINLAVMVHEPGDVLAPDTTAAMANRDAPNGGAVQ